jgi:hypothetical protein
VRRIVVALVALLLLLGVARRAHGQSLPPDTPGEQLHVYLVTMGVGDAVWEKFGHNAIRIVDERTGADVSYNWGIFDFAEPGFLWRFLTGDTRYWMAPEDTRDMIRRYAYYERSVWSQELALSPVQRAALRDFVLWNERPENRYYRYDYYRDNCSTRVRDALDRVLGGQLRRALEPIVTTASYRSHTERLTADDLAVYTGIDVALGQPADRPITAWEEGFIPMSLRDRVRAVRVDDGGAAHPLVLRERVLYESPRPPEAAAPPDRLPLYLAVGLGLAALVVALGLAARAGRAGRAAWATVVAAWSLVAGIGGIVLLLVYGTRHVYWWANENVLQLAPLSLLLVVLAPLALRSAGRAAAAARGVALAVAALALAGLLLKALPWFDQRNGEIVALVLPVHLAVAWSVARLAAARRALPSA